MPPATVGEHRGPANRRAGLGPNSLGQLGVVSGTAIDLIVARRLQVGDPGSRALELPGQLYAHIVRSPYAHAKINGIDSAVRGTYAVTL